MASNSATLYWSPIQSYCSVPHWGALCGLYVALNHWFNPTHILKFQNSIDVSPDIFYQVPDALPIQLFNIHLHCEAFSYYSGPLSYRGSPSAASWNFFCVCVCKVLHI